MMKKKITLKLSVYFLVALISFTIIISLLFFTFYRKTTLDTYKNELIQRATKIAEALSDMDKQMMGNRGTNNSYGSYIRFINDVAMTDVWIVDEDLNIISYGVNAQHRLNSTTDLPDNAALIVSDVFEGKIESSEDFSSFFTSPTLTIGVPILAADNTIIGAVLLHSPVNGMDGALTSAMIIMVISIFVALIITMILAIYLSFGFTKPLKILNQTAIRLINEDYVFSNIKQEDEIGTLALNMDVLAKRLKESSLQREHMEKMRKDFIANISHELRTPITVIRGSLEALNDNVISDEDAKRLSYQQMIKETDHLQRLVSDLLELTKLQNPDFQLNMTTIDLIEVINDSIKGARNIAQQKNIEIKFDNQFTYLKIAGDYDRLKQMIMIIIDNAIKFSHDNSEILIKTYQDDKFHLAISDQGIGIADEELPYIFDRFHKTSSDNQKGSGLGLTIAKQIAMRHDILIDVKSKINHGSTFSFIIDKTA